MLYHVRDYVLPAAYSLLPAPMRSVPASAMLLAIGVQESDFVARAQLAGGPARGWWQFEVAGVVGVRTHPASRGHARAVLAALGYSRDSAAAAIHLALEHNDTLAACFARLLLWTLPGQLPADAHQAEEGWRQYVAAWRPGRPRPEKWDGSYGVAWDALTP